MNDIVVPKRNVPKHLMVPNDKSKISSSIKALQSTDSIESDCEITVKKSEDAQTVEINLDNFQIETKSKNIFDEISVIELDRLLRSDNAFFLIDTRCVRTFRNGHIIGAELFNCSSRIMTTKAKTDWDRSKRQKVIYQQVILYNQRGEKTGQIMDFIDYIMNDCASIRFVTGGYEKYVRHFPQGLIESSIREEKVDNHCYDLTNETNQSSPVFNATPSQILPFLFIGNEMDSLDIEILLKEQITHILNVTTDVPFYHENLIVYKRLPATDCLKQDMRIYFDEAIEFIDAARLKNGRVLVHCWAGVSRSVTIVAAYLLKHSRLNVLQTVKFIKSKRSIAEPNFSFMGQLVRYHSDLQQGIESRSKEPAFANLENEMAQQFACELDDVCNLNNNNNNNNTNNNNNNNNNQSLLSRSTCSMRYPQPRTNCNFIQ